ncbi:MAG TPA: hypothetical protein VJR89_26560 [Polyangiales bacterium]|nr:hypothetical protein [Polyangiales bacterium]
MSSLARSMLKALWLCLSCTAAVGCEQFDPVRTENLCEGPAPISMRCPQCQSPKYSWKCAECQGSNADPELCEPKDDGSKTNPVNEAGRGGSGAGGSEAGRGDSGEPEAGEDGAGSGGMDGGEGGAGESGSGGMSMGGAGAGAGGAPPMDLPYCTDDLWCARMQPSRPHCDTKVNQCLECLTDRDCNGKVCDPKIGRCQTCVVDADCPAPFRACQNNVCLECARDEDCQGGDRDPKLSTCDTRTHTCVDCAIDSKGCSGVLGTCDTGALVCVDCMGDGDCTEDGKPACDTVKRACVPCLLNSHCSDDRVLGTCDVPNRTCVDCLDDTGCSAGTHCDTKVKKCVECLNDGQCASGHCLNQECVECKTDNDCESSDRARCNPSTHTCTGCNADSQCARFGDTPVCDDGTSRCVECNDDSTCGNNSCIRSKHQCSNVPRGSVATCRECEADTMCQTGMRCVPLSFSGSATGSYCVYLRSARSGNCANARGYTQTITRTSIDNSSSSFCIPPATTSCPGSVAAQPGVSGSLCTDVPDCGLGINDAICNASRCTYSCSSTTDCHEGLTCLPSHVCG